ncbi:putative capsular polysaccharide synthesis family protein [Flammeovirga sp. SubArs3]|uniref:putative capsular polysaccharide synthesis family protein n=1 Tax=Flammeovirga sp. SubArs3 TaxID=2995316 RepID=UPI00248B52FD|nr:putative capsular polysaccharide synthesis family protein [Flammeovirga sp. SubArs3]
MNIKNFLRKITIFFRSVIRFVFYNLKIKNEIILVYTMGKVGSSSVFDSIEKNNPYSYVFHVHFLSNNYLYKILPKLDKVFLINIIKGEKVLKVINNFTGCRLKIVTLTREPVSRAISDMFQNWNYKYDDIENISIDIIYNDILNSNFEYTSNWFEYEFKNYLNYDIYKYKFDKMKGYQIYKSEKFDILCIKLELLDSVYKNAFKDFFGEDIILMNTNNSKSKKGNESFTLIYDKLKIDTHKLNKIYNTKYMKYFYTSKEINSFKEKWS